MPEPVRGSGFRTLTESLRQSLPDSVITLVSLRPDLAQPPPHDLAALTARATMSHSVLRALDGLTAWQREVAEALAALPDPASSAAVAELLAADVDPCRQAVDDLRQRALLWGPDERLHLLRAVREQFGPYPGSLAPPSPRPLTPAKVQTLIAECDPYGRRGVGAPGLVADRRPGRRRPPDLDGGGARTGGAVAGPAAAAAAERRDRDSAAGGGVAGPGATVLPRSRQSRTAAGLRTPAETGVDRSGRGRDRVRTGARPGTGRTCPREPSPPPASRRRPGPAGRQRAGPGGQRATPATPAFCSSAARPPSSPPARTECCCPPGSSTGGFGSRRSSAGGRLRGGWRDSPRLFSRSTQTDAHPLGPEADLPYAATLRRLLLDIMAGAGIGLVLDRADLAAAVRWHRPRLARVPLRLEQGIDWLRREAAWLGLTALDATSSLMAVLAGPEQPVPETVADLFPEPVETIIVQADLTAVASGPLPYSLATELRLLADQESRGGGGVYRFSSGSLSRALDAGWSASRIRGWLSQHSTTAIPAAAVVPHRRCRPPPRQRSDRSRRVVPHHGRPVQAAACWPIRGAGSARPAQIGAGRARRRRRDRRAHRLRRTPRPHPAPTRTTARRGTATRAPTPSAPGPASAVRRRSRRGDRGRRAGRPGRRDQSPNQPIVPTRDRRRCTGCTRRYDRRARVSLRLVGADGKPAERRISPLDLDGGQLRAVDLATAKVVTIPLSRVLFASPESSDD